VTTFGAEQQLRDIQNQLEDLLRRRAPGDFSPPDHYDALTKLEAELIRERNKNIVTPLRASGRQ
jgi:hypothetical protein